MHHVKQLTTQDCLSAALLSSYQSSCRTDTGPLLGLKTTCSCICKRLPQILKYSRAWFFAWQAVVKGNIIEHQYISLKHKLFYKMYCLFLFPPLLFLPVVLHSWSVPLFLVTSEKCFPSTLQHFFFPHTFFFSPFTAISIFHYLLPSHPLTFSSPFLHNHH